MLDANTQQFYSPRSTPRLQVEHGVTEQVFGLDLVRWMIELGAEPCHLAELAQALRPQGLAIQVRLYAGSSPAVPLRRSAQPCRLPDRGS